MGFFIDHSGNDNKLVSKFKHWIQLIFLNYGYHPVVPVELLKGDEDVKIEAVENFVDRVQRDWEQAKRNLLNSIKKQQ